MSQSQTLLEMTQEILTSMESDLVDSINDTAESLAVATAIRRTYWDLFGIEDAPEHYSLFKLTETSAATPTLMTIPTNVMRVEWVKYNIETVEDDTDQFRTLEYVELSPFLDRSLALRTSSDNVESFSYTFSPLGSDPVIMQYKNDIAPSCYTTPDDYNILFNSYNSNLETYLRGSKTLAWGLIDPTFTLDDSFVPDLNTRQFALLFNTAKSQCFVELKQTQNATADSRARRIMINSQHTKARIGKVDPLDQIPNYGRRTGNYRRPKSYNQ
jgi:hypothetical protein